MEEIKSITFDREAQDNLPQHIKDKMKAQREEQKSKKETMNTLEIKHVKGYLGTGLKVQYKDLFTNRKRIALLTGITNVDIETTYTRKINGCSGDTISFEGHNNVTDLNVKLLLYPLSSLTKEITHNGETFVPIDRLAKIFDLNTDIYELRFEHLLFVLYNKQKRYYQINDNNFYLFEKLYELHFDIHSLIEKGLAISITTLK